MLLTSSRGRNILIGPGFRSVDLSLLKNFQLREGLRLQFRAESFNAFNHLNFQIPVNFLDDSDVGRVTITANEWREWQFALQRTRALGYSAFNLVALMTLAEAGKRVGVDLYAYQTKDDRGVRRALDYLTPYADAAREWPLQQINEMENARRDLAYLLRRASIAYREAQYEELLEKHLANGAAQQRWQLLWPR